MGRKKAGAAAPGPGQDLLAGGDNDQGGGAKAERDQGAGAGQGGDKPGEEGRAEYQLADDDRELLRQARELDTAATDAGKEATGELTFWSSVAGAFGVISSTVQPAEDVLTTGTFTAWPAGPQPERDYNPATDEADHDAGVQRIEDIAAAVKFDDATRIGRTLTDSMLDILRHRHKPWPAMTESQKRDVATAIDYAVKVELRAIVAAIAAQGRPAIVAKLEQYADKAGTIKATLTIAQVNDDTVLSLHRASGKVVMIVTADADGLMGEEVEIPADQDHLPFTAGSDVVEEEEQDDEDEGDEVERIPAPLPADGGDSGEHGGENDSATRQGAEQA